MQPNLKFIFPINSVIIYCSCQHPRRWNEEIYKEGLRVLNDLKKKFLFNHQKIQSNWELNGRKISHIRARARKYFPRIHCTLIYQWNRRSNFSIHRPLLSNKKTKKSIRVYG